MPRRDPSLVFTGAACPQRETLSQGAGWWIPANTLSRVAAYVVGMIIAGTPVRGFWTSLVFWIVEGLVFGLGTGIVMGWLLQNPKASSAVEPAPAAPDAGQPKPGI